MIDRGVRLARAGSPTASMVLLVAFNVVPLVGVLAWGWSVATLLVLYWVENGIVGILNVPKILLARGRSGPIEGGRVFIAAFFLVHFGLFWFVHGLFVFALPQIVGFGAATAIASGVPDAIGSSLPPGFPTDLIPATTSAPSGLRPAGPDLSAVAVAAVGLAISHMVSLVVNYLGRRENLKVSPAQQAQAPYGRLVILHLAIILGAGIGLALGSPVGAVIVLVLLKTVVDLRFHVREHARLAARPIPA